MPTSAYRDRLGWIGAPRASRSQWPTLAEFAARARDTGLTHTLVCGMGGSSLAPRVLASSFGAGTLAVLDSTDPAAVLAAQEWHDPAHTLYIIASKSGTTVESLAACHHFARRVGPEHFVAVTDPGTPLETLARERGWRGVFAHPADVGGRYAALTVVGMLPAALIGVAGDVLLDRALAVDPNRGRALGDSLAVAAREGRDKLGLQVPPAVASLGDWIEQLVAESTGKEGKGLVPILADPTFAGRDMQVVSAFSTDPLDLGAEFLMWEYATAALGEGLGVNPFDQPDVEEAKAFARAELARPAGADGGSPTTMTPAALVRAARPGDYVAILAYLPSTSENEARLDALRRSWSAATGCVATVGFGPRYLHSTGQLHKGGPNTGLFVVVTAEAKQDIEIPEMRITFGQLERAQAMGDVRALLGKGRRVAHVHLRDAADLPSAGPGD